jgi:hypothetical protein
MDPRPLSALLNLPWRDLTPAERELPVGTVLSSHGGHTMLTLGADRFWHYPDGKVFTGTVAGERRILSIPNVTPPGADADPVIAAFHLAEQRGFAPPPTPTPEAMAEAEALVNTACIEWSGQTGKSLGDVMRARVALALDTARREERADHDATLEILRGWQTLLGSTLGLDDVRPSLDDVLRAIGGIRAAERAKVLGEVDAVLFAHQGTETADGRHSHALLLHVARQDLRTLRTPNAPAPVPPVGEVVHFRPYGAWLTECFTSTSTLDRTVREGVTCERCLSALAAKGGTR